MHAVGPAFQPVLTDVYKLDHVVVRTADPTNYKLWDRLSSRS
jgi:hypothetical protein